MLLRHPKEESFSLNVMKGKTWCMLLWLCLILGKYVAANFKKGYSQVGNELLHEVGSSWIVKVNPFVRFNLLTLEEQYKRDLTCLR